MIRKNTYIDPSAVVYDCVKVGDNVKIGPGCVIGGPGFGYTLIEGELWQAKRHDYGVVIEDDVEIGANTCIDCGSWRNTVIGCGTKIDNLVHIAHNVQVGKNCLIVAQAGLGGSVIVGDNVWVGFGAHVNQRLVVHKDAFIGTGAVVTKDVPAKMVVAGVPAKVIRERTPEDA
jgi:UDP-3-O-[3-hydroxymyristoyl] glucosamine N-acyltransferase